MLSNLRHPASCSHPDRKHCTPTIKRPFIITASFISFNGMKSCRGLPRLDNQYKSLVKFNLQLTCDLKSNLVACGAKVKECDFPVISTTKIDVTNLFDLKNILRRNPGW